MAALTPSLDERTFQNIVDEAKSLIPQFCPEWTDHNVSDPGVALIELFAWMTEMLLYRVNQIPERIYYEFLNLIGLRLRPPQAAVVPVTFYLTAPPCDPVTIKAGTEVATLRTETDPAIVFTLESDAIVRAPSLVNVMTRNTRRTGAQQWTPHDVRRLQLGGQEIDMFPEQPTANDALYLGFQEDHSNHVLALTVNCPVRGAGVDPDDPPRVFEVWQGGLMRSWGLCEVERDSSGGFNQTGEIILRLPSMAAGQFNNLSGYWLRCRVIQPSAGRPSYRRSPTLRSLRIDAQGVTGNARHLIVVNNETLGRSDGTSRQMFKLQYAPVLALDNRALSLSVLPPGQPPESWQEVDDFAGSGPDDKYFTLDHLTGAVNFGPALLQPDGSVYSFGAVPAQGSQLRFERYTYGGGVAGNVSAGALSVVKSSIPNVRKVTNWKAATGGRDAQTLEDARIRVPEFLRTQNRAVTAFDYEYLATQVSGAARAHCIGPGVQGSQGELTRPGQVLLLVLPDADTAKKLGRIEPESLTLSAELRASVLAALENRMVLGASLEVRAPRYHWISVEAKVRVAEADEPGVRSELHGRAEAALYRYLNPYSGGRNGEGWPFGRDLHVSEVYSVLHAIPGVQGVEEIKLRARSAGDQAPSQPVSNRVAVTADGLICSDHHQITIAGWNEP